MNDQAAAQDGMLDIVRLVDMFETAEEASADARKLAERDRDYVDNKQLTAAEKAELAKRKQPEVIINRIKRKVDFMRGYEMSRQVKPKAMPRTPKHEHDADAIQQALRYVADEQDFDRKRSRVFDNLLVEGMAGYRVGASQGRNGEVVITIDQVRWDRMFADPHSSEPDFSDAGYLGGVIWRDLDDALLDYPDSADALNETLNTSTLSETFDDRPRHKVWADRARRRVRIVFMWIKRGDQWYFAEFTKGGILKAGPSPYKTDKGESDCELIYGSAYCDRDNNRYGLVREMISPQDEINKRRSKALHYLNVNQITMEEGAVSNLTEFRKQAALPDGIKIIAPGYSDRVKVENRVDLAAAHLQLLQEAKGEIDMMAGNIALQGNALQRSQASGKAIIASQQGGAMEIAPIMSALSHLDLRVFRAAYYRVRQFWTAEKWVRVTDDERNTKWLGLNVDPTQMQMLAASNPQMLDQISGVIQNVGDIDCDIIIDDAPDGITPQIEQFEALVNLKQMDANNEIPFSALIDALPNIKAKERILAAIEKNSAQETGPPPELIMAQQKMEMERAKIEADVQKVQNEIRKIDMQVEAARETASLTAENKRLEMEADRARIAMELEMKQLEMQIKIAEIEAKRNAEIRTHAEKFEREAPEREAAGQREAATVSAITHLGQMIEGMQRTSAAHPPN